MKKISRKGRPRKDAITKLKVIAWFRAVAEASGKTSAQLEREFADPNHIRRSKDKNQEIRPGLWDKYRRGEVEPRAHPINENRVSVVQAVEAKYPGTARVLTLPLWKLLDFSQPVTMEELDAIEKTLPLGIRHLHRGKSVLGKEFPQLGEEEESELLQSQAYFDNAINQWTMMAILVREKMKTLHENLIGQLRTQLDTTNPRRRQQRGRQNAEDIPPKAKFAQQKSKQASLF